MDLNSDLGESFGAWRMGDDACWRLSPARILPAVFTPGIRQGYWIPCGQLQRAAWLWGRMWDIPIWWVLAAGPWTPAAAN